MSSDERQKIHEVFKQHDSNNDGHLSIEETIAGALALGVNTSEDELLSWLKTYYDKTEYEPFDSLEFAAFVLRNRFQKETDDEVKQAFEMFDQNGDGYVSFDELKAIFISLGQGLSDLEIKGMLEQADSDGDGKISFEEFKSIQ